ncbi:hypothetical protein PWG71_18110 [Nocardiopsis sp. N85]|uniref:hypothetical protein n=1 Tax=Nocardiopsis sp. N85 TaxID=3029400 RepID=UPI00237FC734|nr:hypothetical protein [Nocardiopsis sp. N85]MDE3723311.1 hypothetical protein [Nocardiopsis sp. N85]
MDSADAGLYFEASLSYGWTLEEGAGPILHPDEVARSLLLGAVRAATAEHPVLHVDEAQSAANRELSREITTDDRITVVGHVRLGISADTEARARARHLAAERVRREEDERIMRLQVLRERVLSQDLGLVWWLERNGTSQGAAGPAQWTRELIESHGELVAALRREHAVTETREDALLRARVDEALALVADPETAARFARHLGDYIAHIPARPSDE